VGLVSVRRAGLESAQGNSLSLIRATSTTVDKWRVEPMDIVVLIVNEEPFSDCIVAVCKCLNVEPKVEGQSIGVVYFNSSGSRVSL
jgi:hypothetical protein